MGTPVTEPFPASADVLQAQQIPRLHTVERGREQVACPVGSLPSSMEGTGEQGLAS